MSIDKIYSDVLDYKHKQQCLNSKISYEMNLRALWLIGYWCIAVVLFSNSNAIRRKMFTKRLFMPADLQPKEAKIRKSVQLPLIRDIDKGKIMIS